MSDLFGLKLSGDGSGGYLLDGEVRQFETHTETILVRQADGSCKKEPLEIRRSVHGPVVAEQGGRPVAMKVSLGLYPIVTFQYNSTTLYQFSYHIR